MLTSPDALIKGKPIPGAPNIAISGFDQVGITPPEGRNDITGHLTDIVSYTTGRHQFRFGGEVRQGRVDEFYYRRSLGSFNFDGSQGHGRAVARVLIPLARWRTFWPGMYRRRRLR